MELKEFVKLLKDNFKIFIVILVGVILIDLIVFNSQTKFYNASIGVDIAREKNQEQSENKDYQYDQYYRLQADEKFAKNIISWLDDPVFLKLNQKDFNENKIGKWENVFALKASQSSSNYIKINYKAKDTRSAFLFGKILKKNLEQKNQQLNFDQNNNWFKLIMSDVYVEKNNPSLPIFLIIAILLGITFGILGVLIKYYFNPTENENRN